jgi:hypothetical protein
VLGEKEVSGLGLAPLTVDIGTDDTDRSKYTAYVQQPLLSLPDPAFYYIKPGSVKLVDEVTYLEGNMHVRIRVGGQGGARSSTRGESPAHNSRVFATKCNTMYCTRILCARVWDLIVAPPFPR